MKPQKLVIAFADLFAEYGQIKKAYILDKKYTDIIEANFLAWGQQMAKTPTLSASEMKGWIGVLDTTKGLIKTALDTGRQSCKTPGIKDFPWGLVGLGAGALALFWWVRNRN